MAVIAVIMSVNFAACSDDDDNNSNDKKLVKVEFTDGSYKYIETYKYDKEGRVTEYQGIDKNVNTGNTEVYTYTYIYTDAKISITRSDNDDDIIYTLNNGVIVSADRGNGDEYFFKYDDNKQLIGITSSSKEFDMTFTWSNDNIVKSVKTIRNSGMSAETYTYDMTYANTSYRFLGSELPYYDSKLDNFLFSYGYFGKCCKNLPKYMRDFGEVDYQIDNEGYVTGMVDEDGETYRFFYE